MANDTQMIFLSPLQTPPLSDNNDSLLLEYSSESLLQNSLVGNFALVREILLNGDFNYNVSKQSKITKFGDQNNNHYNTIAGEPEYLPKFKIDLEVVDDAKQTPLILASRFGHTNIGSILIEYGAKVNSNDMDSWTPLLNAAKEGNDEILEILLDNKAFIESRDMGGFTPLMWTCYKNKPKCAKLLIENGANVNAQCKNTVCCLSWAAGRGHTEVVAELIKSHSIKINLQDRNNSTPLLWAARKGNLAITQLLIEKHANPDAIGMHNMTPLIMSCKNGHSDVAMYLAKLNDTTLNQLDKDGQSALGYACKAGNTELAMILLEKGAYVNIPNKKGDTILITAVKGSHTEIIDALISRHVEIDAIGNQGKTALHHAIEKGNVEIVRSILTYKPYLEVVAQDGDTLLLLAVKRKCTNIVSELLTNGAKVSPTDKNGDNVLHISLRNRSKDITELLLANPKNSKYLYKPNKTGETPHKIDASNPKSILTQIFGARQLNMTEDSILGYDLYSSALSEMLSEPSLHTPITVGLYAKWGSGKSFLLSQLKAEMKSFARLTRVVYLKTNFFLLLTVIMLSLLVATPFLFWRWEIGLIVYGSLLAVCFLIIVFSKYFHERKEREWAERICNKLSTQISRFKLLLQVLFLNPYVSKNQNTEHKNLRFIFTDYGKISTIGGENALAIMVSGLYTKMENQLGLVVTRLCRVFYNKTHSHDKFKKFCCIPTFILAILIFLMMIALLIFIRVRGVNINNYSVEEKAFVSTFGLLIIVSAVGSSVTWIKMIWNLIRSPKSRIRSIHMAHSNNDGKKDPKLDSFIFKLKREVDLIAHTVKTIDSFSHSCTRLVIIIDGLDSCEQSKVVQILEIIHVLFTREGDPFISILAVDPHVLIKGIEGNLTEAFRNGSVNGNDYLRTIIHLPVFLQVDLSRAKAISKMPLCPKKSSNTSFKGSQDVLHTRKFDTDINSKNRKKKKGRRGTSISTKPMSAYDLTDQLIKSDYFLDVNPRNLRRLINIIALTGRLLRAYHIDFNWRLLASWIYLNEQWPYRCSWLIMYYEEHENEFDEHATLNEVYERVKNKIPISNEPLLEMDRNARKFEQFIQNCKPALTVMILQRLLPCTCNLDPYLIKLIKDSIDAFQEKFDLLTQLNGISSNQTTLNPALNPNLTFSSNSNLNPNIFSNTSISANFPSYLPGNMAPDLRGHGSNNSFFNNNNSSSFSKFPTMSKNHIHESVSFDYPGRNTAHLRPAALRSLDEHSSNENIVEINMSKPLRQMTVNDVIEEIDGHIDFLNEDYKQIYKANLRENNINGKVLACCDLTELKSELQMTFGDWQLFRDWISRHRSKEIKVQKQRRRATKSPPKADNFYELKQQAEMKSQEKTNEEEKPLETSQLKNQNDELSDSMKSNRKVEFFITPVIEVTKPPNISKNLETPVQKSILMKQTSSTSNESRSFLDTRQQRDSISSVKSNPEEPTSSVHKFGKKIYEMISKNAPTRKSKDELRTSQHDLALKSKDIKQNLLETDEEYESKNEDEDGSNVSCEESNASYEESNVSESNESDIETTKLKVPQK